MVPVRLFRFSIGTLLVAITLLAVVAAYAVRQRGDRTLTETGRDLDIAIIGDGLFEFSEGDSGKVYSRDGRLSVNADGQLVHKQTGRVLQPPISIPMDAQQVLVTPDGEFCFQDTDMGNWYQSDQLQLVMFNLNEDQLVPCGDGFFRPGPNSTTPMSVTPGDHGSGSIHAGWHEHRRSPSLLLFLCVPVAVACGLTASLVFTPGRMK